MPSMEASMLPSQPIRLLSAFRFDGIKLAFWPFLFGRIFFAEPASISSSVDWVLKAAIQNKIGPPGDGGPLKMSHMRRGILGDSQVAVFMGT